ncbi:MAG: TM0106 family RecB-like putative nuclease [Cyanobacteriota bacterium]|nr:TM0106 family RecB-like putative nuclease [Cyanobacteriota bacterium]
MFLTDTQLLSYQRCPRQTFLEVYGDRHKRDPKSDFLLKLIQDSLAFDSSFLEDQIYHKPDYPRGDWNAGAEATLALMQQGVATIYRGIIQMSYLSPQGEPLTLMARPRLLKKQPKPSEFGDWSYVPADLKLGKRPKLDYQLVAAFNAHILASVQGTWPDTAWLIFRKKAPFAVNLELRVPGMEAVLSELIEMLAKKQEPEVFMSRQKCSLCTWYSSCHSLASSQQHLSLVPGVTPSRYSILKTLNLTALDSLAEVEPEVLAVYPQFPDVIADRVVLQAKSSLENRPFLSWELTRKKWELDSHPDPIPLYYDRLPKLISAPVELYFDIEAQPENNLDYLHGVLVVDNRNNTKRFEVMLAENATEEEAIWEQLLKLFWQYPIAPIYHFCEYETQTIKRLAGVYKTPAYKWKPLLKRCVDVHKLIKETATLPVESYALKHIARWLGFEWRDENANGAQSVCWYDRWLKTGDRSVLEAIVRYNEDDCYATYSVKEWLENFISQAVI